MSGQQALREVLALFHLRQSVLHVLELDLGPIQIRRESRIGRAPGSTGNPVRQRLPQGAAQDDGRSDAHEERHHGDGFTRSHASVPPTLESLRLAMGREHPLGKVHPLVQFTDLGGKLLHRVPERLDRLLSHGGLRPLS